MTASAPAALAAALGATLACILLLNEGTFTYTLDDAYIHLALAEGLASGHYGVNPGEVASPSSSILWPLLLVPFAGTPAHEYLPLALNVLFALLTVTVLQKVVGRVLDRSVPGARFQRTLLVCCLAAGLNLVGLAFTGMEHGLQVWLAVTLAHGLIVEAEEGRLSPWLVVAILLGPLVRYENTVLSLAAVLYLALRGRPRLALGLGVGFMLPLAAFSWFLLGLGLDWLPASVLVKAGLAHEPGAIASSVFERLRGVASALAGPWETIGFGVSMLLGALLAAAALRRRDRRAERPLAAAGLVALAGHLALGRYGWFGRYEVYLLAALGCLLLYCYRNELGRWYHRTPGWRGAAATIVAMALLGAPYLRATWLTPQGANNIYEQQYQMHRFAVSFGGPVAVNDLGRVAYRNEAYVLDLAALGSTEALRAARTGEVGWQRRLVRRHGVELAMLYDDWAQDWLPGDWVLLARLSLGRRRVTPARDSVEFYATSPAAAAAIRPRLAAFAATLPEGVRFETVGGAGAGCQSRTDDLSLTRRLLYH